MDKMRLNSSDHNLLVWGHVKGRESGTDGRETEKSNVRESKRKTTAIQLATIDITFKNMEQGNTGEDFLEIEREIEKERQWGTSIQAEWRRQEQQEQIHKP